MKPSKFSEEQIAYAAGKRMRVSRSATPFSCAHRGRSLESPESLRSKRRGNLTFSPLRTRRPACHRTDSTRVGRQLT
jgi:hypothetical protein